MKFHRLRTPSRYRRSGGSLNGGIRNTRVVVLTSEPQRRSSRRETGRVRLPLLVQLSSFFCALFEWCVVVGGRPVPGSHPSSRRSSGGLTQRSQRCRLVSSAVGRRGRWRPTHNRAGSSTYRSYCMFSEYVSKINKMKSIQKCKLYLHALDF